MPSFTVCVSATEELLSTSSSLRSVLGATSTASDAYQLDLLRRASVWVAQQLGYRVFAQSYNEVVESYGGRKLMLEHAPIRAVLRFFDSTSTDEATAICSSEFRAHRAEGMLERAAGWYWTAGVNYGLDKFVVPNSESQPWLVEYVAGWTLDGLSTSSANYSTQAGTTSTGRTLPYDIQHAALLKAPEWASAPIGGITSESLGDLSVTYANSALTYRSEAETILAPYRRLF